MKSWMNKQSSEVPKICILTQTASEVSAYYRQLFQDFDLFFVTYRQKNSKAIAFLPNSTWSEGRNYLWEYVKGKYDYYLFIDDDLEFFGLSLSTPVYSEYLLHLLNKAKKLLPINKLLPPSYYKRLSPSQLKEMLYEKVINYQPMVASFKTLSQNSVDYLDLHSLSRNRRVRPTGWFDAQVTLFSGTAANLLLPYDTSFSGWWSAQIPIYCLSHLAFKDKSIYILDIGANNLNSDGIYRPGYDGFEDCKKMAAWLSAGFKNNSYDSLYIDSINNVNCNFASNYARNGVKQNQSNLTTIRAVLTTLEEYFNLQHPYVYERHHNLVNDLKSFEKLK
jgi:hypothetical protein